MTYVKCYLAAVIALCLIGPVTHAMAAPSDGATLVAIQRAIDAADLTGAERLIAELSTNPTQAARARYFRGLLAFHHGDYGLARQEMTAALTDDALQPPPASWQQMRELATATDAVVSGMQVHRSADRRYVVHVGADDALLAPYALTVLEAADRALSTVLGERVPGPIRLEIYPSAATLATVSPLTQEQIETSGTIALCKWNRLMVTSPRALLRGYPWADTITHELAHLLLSAATHDRAPVWLHEGIAKMLERRWRGHPNSLSHETGEGTDLRLDVASKSLLSKAAADGKLLSFEQLHPSIAMLPSQRDAALAFAQVATFMHRFVAKHGEIGLRQALARVASGADTQEALASIANTTFPDLVRQWRAAIPPPQVAGDQARVQVRRLRRGAEEQDDLTEVEQEAARRYLRLGDMLWSRRRTPAAAIEYGKAHAVAPDDPVVASRYARSALQAGDASTAARTMQRLLGRYPDHAPALSILAQAALAQGQHDEARRAAKATLLVNPFDPEPHCVLARVSPSDLVESELCRALR